MKVDVDKWGAVASALCAVHCALTGFLLALLPLIGLEFLHSPWMEVFFFSCALGFGTTAVVHGIRRHHSAIPGIIFATGVLGLVIGHFGFGHQGGPAAGVANVTAGLALVTFHALNIRMAHRCKCAGCRHE